MNLVGTFVAGLTSLLFLCGCVHLPLGNKPPGRALLPPQMLEQLARAPEETVAVRETEDRRNSRYQVRRIELHVTTPQRGTNFAVVCEYFQSRRPHAPVILLLPMAGGSYPIERYFARYFVRQGFAVVLLHRRKFSHQLDLAEINPWIVASVQDGQRALDWIETRPELDASRIGLFGISLGGLKGTLLTAADSRIKAAILGLVGSDLPYILAHSSEPKVTRQREQLLREKNFTPAQLEEHLREIIRWDPGRLSAHLDSRQLMLVLAAFDHVVPFKKGWELRARLSKPETLLTLTGHYSAALAIPGIQVHALRFFREKLAVSPAPVERLRSPRDAAATSGPQNSPN